MRRFLSCAAVIDRGEAIGLPCGLSVDVAVHRRRRGEDEAGAAAVHRRFEQPLRGGEIVLRVTDGHGKTLPGVTVTLIAAEEPHAKVGGPVITPPSGEARFTGLQQGRYLVRCEMIGFISETLGPLPIELKEPSPRLPDRIEVALPAGPIWY